MSTKALRDIIEAYRKTSAPIPERHPKVLAALYEVEAIEKAARDVVTPRNPKEEAHALLQRIAKESKWA